MSIMQLIVKARHHAGFRRYFSNTSWVFAEQILRILTGVFVGIWVARFLGPEKFGQFSYAIAFSAIFSGLAKLGLDGVVTRELIRLPSERDIYLGTAFWLKGAGSILMLLAIFIAIQFSPNDQTTNLYIFIISCGSIFQSFEVIDFYFQSRVLSKYVSLCKLVQLAISSLLKIYLVIKGSELLCFVWVSLVDQITLGLALCVSYRNREKSGFYLRFDKKVAAKLLVNGWPFLVSGVVILIYMRIDQIMIKQMLGEAQVGLYSAATRLSEVWYVVPAIISNSLFPSIINSKKIDEKLYDTRIQGLYALVFWMAVLIAVPMTFCSGIIINILYGKNFEDAATVLTIQIWAALFVFLGVASVKWYVSENLQRYLIFNTVIGAIVNIALNLALIPTWGIQGAAIATVISQAVASLLMNLVFKATRENFYNLMRAMNIFRVLSTTNGGVK